MWRGAGRKELSSLHPGERQPVPRRTEAQQPDTWGARNVSVCLSAPPPPLPSAALGAEIQPKKPLASALGLKGSRSGWKGPGKRRSMLLWPGEEQLSLPPSFPSMKCASSLLCLKTTPQSMWSGPCRLALHQPADPGDPSRGACTVEGAEAGFGRPGAGAGVDWLGELVARLLMTPRGAAATQGD